MATDATKPCLVQAGQGFSVLYNERYLYSRYNPEKAALQTVASLTVLPGTVIIVAAPLLWYGMDELFAKLPTECTILAIELESALQELTEKTLETKPYKNDSRLSLLTAKALSHFEDYFPPLHTVRRAILVELSGASQLHKDAYHQIARSAEHTIATFWKNRLTLTRFGRLYARNLFKNLGEAKNCLPRICIEKPIIVVGAGESAELTVRALQALPEKQRSCFFLLAVDAALPMLTAHQLDVDGVVAVESQLAIEKAYIGQQKHIPLLLCDAVSRPAVIRRAQKQGARIHFFLSDYTHATYLSELKEQGILPPLLPPLGSVGLTATFIALSLRASSDIPIFVTGLDFSFSLGCTHARGAPAHIMRLCTHTRLKPLAAYEAAYKPGASAVHGKNGLVYTDRALSGYAEGFRETFSGNTNLYDCGESGLFLSLPCITNTALATFLNTAHADTHSKPLNASAPMQSARTQPVPVATAAIKAPTEQPATVLPTDNAFAAYAKKEVSALTRIKALLTHSEAVRSPTMSVQDELTALITPRDYLYLHFPDGFTCKSADLSFLKRIRSELDFFIKDLTTALSRH